MAYPPSGSAVRFLPVLPPAGVRLFPAMTYDRMPPPGFLGAEFRVEPTRQQLPAALVSSPGPRFGPKISASQQSGAAPSSRRADEGTGCKGVRPEISRASETEKWGRAPHRDVAIDENQQALGPMRQAPARRISTLGAIQIE